MLTEVATVPFPSVPYSPVASAIANWKSGIGAMILTSPEIPPVAAVTPPATAKASTAGDPSVLQMSMLVVEPAAPSTS